MLSRISEGDCPRWSIHLVHADRIRQLRTKALPWLPVIRHKTDLVAPAVENADLPNRIPAWHLVHNDGHAEVAHSWPGASAHGASEYMRGVVGYDRFIDRRGQSSCQEGGEHQDACESGLAPEEVHCVGAGPKICGSIDIKGR
jgi:hypothetical protein